MPNRPDPDKNPHRASFVQLSNGKFAGTIKRWHFDCGHPILVGRYVGGEQRTARRALRIARRKLAAFGLNRV